MQRKINNKAVMPGQDVNIQNKGVQDKYFFPDEGVTVEAKSREEAEKKFKEVVKKSK